MPFFSYRSIAAVAAVLVSGFAASAGAESAGVADGSGFRVTTVEVAAERDAPQACFTFGGRLEKLQGRGYAPFVEVVPALPALSVVARDRTLCIDGLAHGATYTVTLRQGLPGADGQKLAAADTRAVEVPNRAPALAFRGAGAILPRVGPEGLRLRAINVDRIRLRVLRVADRTLVEKIYAGRVGQTLGDWDVGELVEKSGSTVWTGELPVAAARNVPATAIFPLAPLLDTLEPGVYLATAEAGAPGPEAPRSNQWFVVSDLGLTSFFGDDGLTVFARSLTSALPLAGVDLHLLARNGKVLAKGATGADGIARFEAEVTRRGGDEAAQALFAYGGTGEFSVLDLAAPGVDLSGRGATGRSTPGPLDAFIATERAIYRPGETVSVTSLLRDATARAVTGRSWLLTLQRPDGVEADRREVKDGGAGGGTAGFTLPQTTLPGLWTIAARVEPEGPVIGHAEFTVHELLPPRLEMSLAAAGGTLTPEDTLALAIEGRTLSGAPAARLPGELSLTIRAAESPFPGHDGYRFGLAQETLVPIQTVLPGFITGGDGRASTELPPLKLPETTHPLQAVIRGTLFDIGGRAVSRELVLPIRHQPLSIGLRPRFEDETLPEGATAAFDVIALGRDGAAADKAALSYELYEEESDFRWFEAAGGHWDYETIVHDHRLTGGTVTVNAGQPATLEEPVRAGHYRLEVFDPKSGAATSVRFVAGWWATPAAANRPDKVDVSVMRSPDGAQVHVHIRPPYDSQVVIAVADRSIHSIVTRQIGAGGAFIDLPVSPDWSAGVTVIATAYAAVDSVRKTAPRRAIGAGWLAAEPLRRTLTVTLDAPAVTEPRRTVTVPVTVRDAAGALLPAGDSAYLTLAAVDEAVLQVTDQPLPDPVSYYLGQRRLAVELRDVYGRLLEPAKTDAPAPAHGTAPEKKRVKPVPGLPERDAPVVTLFSGLVKVGADGTARVPLEIPDFDGRLRLLALAWTGDQLGRAEAVLDVRDLVRAELSLPHLLSPGDRAVVDIGLVNLAAAPGDYRVSLTGEGGLSVADGQFTTGLKKGRRVAFSRQLTADRTGMATVRLEITGPDGYRLVRSRNIRVRAAARQVWRHQAVTLAPDQSLALPAGLFEGLRPDTVTAAIGIGPLPALDLPGLVMTADRMMRGNVEQVASGVARLVAGGDLPLTLGLDTADSLRNRVQTAIDRLIAQQHGDGGFAVWSLKEETDPALTPFVADILDRAAAAGYRVPEPAIRRVREWLKRQLENGWIEDRDLANRAHATYALARAKALDAGAVHYFHETFGARLSSALARAQIAAALAAVGDGDAARDQFDHLATDLLGDARGQVSLRDFAGTIALGGESGALSRERLIALAERAAARTPAPEARLAAADLAWLALAARALSDHAASPEPVGIAFGDDLVETDRPLYRHLDPAAPPRLRNPGPAPLAGVVSVVGLPAEQPGAASQGFTLSRSLFNLDGAPLKPDAVHQSDLVVVVLEGAASGAGRQRIVVGDQLPAGLEVETVRFADSPQLGDLSWLGELSLARYTDSRYDRFLAVLDLEAGHPGFRVVYLARAIGRGDFVEPGATVEAVDAPDRFARTAPARMVINGGGKE